MPFALYAPEPVPNGEFAEKANPDRSNDATDNVSDTALAVPPPVSAASTFIT
ncbi:hypothetical protein D3C75_687370 [compost metagenome]